MQELLDLLEQARELLAEDEVGSDAYTLSHLIDIALKHHSGRPCGLGSWCGVQKCQEEY